MYIESREVMKNRDSNNNHLKIQRQGQDSNDKDEIQLSKT